MFIGHQKQQEFLKKSSDLGKASRSFLFSGEDKLGKKTLALQWISSIRKSPLKKEDPDFILVEPFLGSKSIQISQIRNLIWRLQLTSSGSFKAALIDNAHLMTVEAQHALLKTLEEPKGKTILILITSKPETLFSTIRSRCENINFYPVARAEIESYLQKQDLSKEKVQLIASLSRGKPGEAIDLFSDPQKLKDRKLIIEELEKILNSPLYMRFQYTKDLASKENLEEIFQIWLEFLRNSLLSSNFNQNPILLKKTKKNIEFLEKISFLIKTTNINSKIALETFFSQL